MRPYLVILLAVLTVAALAHPASAQPYRFLGMTVFHDNDVLIDGDDRWQTGGASWSFLFGPAGTRSLPAGPGEVWELRIRGQVITPDDFTAPAAWDRRAASVVTTTLRTHFQSGGLEMSLGGGVAVTGAETGLIDFQNFIHLLTPADDPMVPASVQAAQIPAAVYPAAIAEAAYRFRLGEGVAMRPFAEIQTGAETLVRAGADVFFGPAWDKGVLARDGTTGFSYQTLEGTAPRGWSFTLGADAAYVAASALLPAPSYTLTPLRLRARAGAHYQGRWVSAFAGVTWLGREFTAQPTGQAVTALQLQWQF